MKKDKDWNYVASVEKAIADKYGKDTVQDFRTNWSEEDEKQYLSQLKQANKKKQKQKKNRTFLNDDTEIVKRKNFKKTDRTCPVCKTYSFLYRDDLYMNRFNCCSQCYVDFVEFRQKEWYEGQRPSKEDIQNALRRRKKNVKHT